MELLWNKTIMPAANIVCPGIILTPMADKMMAGEAEAAKELLKEVPHHLRHGRG